MEQTSPHSRDVFQLRSNNFEAPEVPVRSTPSSQALERDVGEDTSPNRVQDVEV